MPTDARGRRQRDHKSSDAQGPFSILQQVLFSNAAHQHPRLHRALRPRAGLHARAVLLRPAHGRHCRLCGLRLRLRRRARARRQLRLRRLPGTSQPAGCRVLRVVDAPRVIRIQKFPRAAVFRGSNLVFGLCVLDAGWCDVRR